MRSDRVRASLRRELRERLMSGRADGVDEVLRTLRLLAGEDAELISEHARWAMRFELLAYT